MDYHENDLQGQNLHIAGEGSSNISPILRPYDLPRFDFDDSLQSHLRFESLVENESFLGIARQEDNQWIEEYSRENSVIEFNSSAPESCSISRHNNVWSEATSSESVEMLLNSVGHAEGVLREAIAKELDTGNDHDILTEIANSDLKQGDSKDNSMHSQVLPSEEFPDKFLGLDDSDIGKLPRFEVTSDSQAAVQTISEFNSKVESAKCPSVPEVHDRICRDASKREGVDVVIESLDDKAEKDISGSAEERNDQGDVRHVSEIFTGKSNVVYEDADINNKLLNGTSVEIFSYKRTCSLRVDSRVETAENDSNEMTSLPLVRDCNTSTVEGCEIELKSAESVQVPFSSTCLESNEQTDCSMHTEDSHLAILGNDCIQVNTIELPNTNSDTTILSEPNKTCSPSNTTHAQIWSSEKVNAIASEGLENGPVTSSPVLVPGETSTEKSIADSNTCEVRIEGSDAKDHFLSPMLSIPGDAHREVPSSEPNSAFTTKEISPFVKEVSKSPTVNSVVEYEVSKTLDSDMKVESLSPGRGIEGTNVITNVTKTEIPAQHEPVDLSNESISFEASLCANLDQSGKIAKESSLQVGGHVELKMGQEMRRISMDTPQESGTVITQVGAKGTPERKPRRKSAVKETAKRGNRAKETSLGSQFRSEDISSKTAQLLQFKDLKSNENAELGGVKRDVVIPLSNVPDLNSSDVAFQQPFTDNQQVQLRAQIFVYGDLIKKVTPDEACMNAAFGGHFDGSGKPWESAWKSHGEKSLVDNCETPVQLRLGSDQSTKQGSRKSKGLPSPVGQANKKATPVVNPMITLSSPLRNVTTPFPSSNGFQSSRLTNTLLDNHPSASPLFSYKTPPVHTSAGKTPWMSPGSFPGQWVATSSVSALNASARFSALPYTEAVTLTPVKDSGGLEVKLASPVPVENSTVLSVMPGLPSLNEVQKQLSSGQPSTDSKSRKRKTFPVVSLGQICLPAQVQPVLVSSPFLIGQSNSQTPLLAQSQTKYLACPVSSIYSTTVTVSKPASLGTECNASEVPLSASPTFSNDHLRSGYQKKEKPVISEDKISKNAVSVENYAVPSVFSGSPSLDEVQNNLSIGRPSADLKSRKRKKIPDLVPVAQVSLPAQTQPASVSSSVVIGQSHAQIPILAQSHTKSFVCPVSSLYSTSTVSTSAPLETKSSASKFPLAGTPTSSNDHLRSGNQSKDKPVMSEDAISKVAEAKALAEDAAIHAAAAVCHCESVWSRLERQRSSNVLSDVETKLASAAVAVAAAASVAKVAAAAAKIASTAAEQAKLMSDEALSSGVSSVSSVVTNVGKTTPELILQGGNGCDHSSSVLTAAKEAAKKRVEAASAASKHAENLNAIVKAAELAAEAVSQAGKIVAMGEPLSLNELVKSGPEGYWKSPLLSSSGQQGVMDSKAITNTKTIESRQSDEDFQLPKCCKTSGEISVDLGKEIGVLDVVSGSLMNNEKDLGSEREDRYSNTSKTICVTSESEAGLSHNLPGPSDFKISSVKWKVMNITDGCLVEVYKDKSVSKAGWFAANVLSMADGKAFVCYSELESDDGLGKLKEWLPLDGEGTEVPRIRVAHPMTSMSLEGSRKRRRAATADYAWSVGDKVDAWTHNCWREGVVTERNKHDDTSLTIRFRDQGETLVARVWNLRPTLMWKGGEWIDYFSSKVDNSAKSDKPKEKRLKLGNPGAEGKDRNELSEKVILFESEKQDESKFLPLTAAEKIFNVGKVTKDDKKLNANRTTSGLKKEGPRVTFGVPQPGKNQKFMDVSKHYVADRTRENNKASNDSLRFGKHPRPQGSGPPHGWNFSSRNVDARGTQAPETKSRSSKSGKSQNLSGQTIAQKDNFMPSAESVLQCDGAKMDNKVRNSTKDFENKSNGGPNLMEFGSSIAEDSKKASTTGSSRALPPRVPTSNDKSVRMNKRKFVPTGGKSASVDVTDKVPEIVEPRRSVRIIQPTSRLLEGLQSELTTIPKVPASTHRNQCKVTTKGSSSHGKGSV